MKVREIISGAYWKLVFFAYNFSDQLHSVEELVGMMLNFTRQTAAAFASMLLDFGLFAQ